MSDIVKGIYKLFNKKSREKSTEMISLLLKEKHGTKTKVCAVWACNGLVHWTIDEIKSVVDPKEPIEILIRKLTGQFILMRYGILPEEKIPTVFLIPFPSLVGLIGYKKYFKFIKEWTGQSIAADKEAVRYKLFYEA
jgi:hypothetical protein